MHNRGMADRHKISKNTRKVIGQVEHGVVLNIRVMSDDDFIDVPPENGVVPYTRMIAEGHVTQDCCAFGDVNPLAQRWLFMEKGLELLFQFAHADFTGFEVLHISRY